MEKAKINFNDTNAKSSLSFLIQKKISSEPWTNEIKTKNLRETERESLEKTKKVVNIKQMN